MLHLTQLLAVGAALAIAAPLASAQSFNVDLGDPASPAGVPTAAYGAAAGQPGTWNAFGDIVAYSGAIVGLGGAATGVTLVGPPFAFDIDFNNVLTTGDDQALLDDLADVFGDTFTFNGLQNGFYQIYTYAFAPDDPTAVTSVTPTGVTTTNVGGSDWSGMHVEGVTYAVHCVQVTTGTVSITGDAAPGSPFGSFNGFQFKLLPGGCPGSFPESCFGDGGDQLGCTNCPCGNNAPIGAGGGCLNTNGASTGARIVASGSPDVSTPADTLHFDVVGANVSTFGILVSGSAQLPNNPANICFTQNPGSGVTSAVLDGLRCVGGASVIRHGSRATDGNGDIGITNNGWGPPNNPLAGLGVVSGFTAGQTRHFQVFYRENAGAGCLTGQNTTNAVSVTFF